MQKIPSIPLPLLFLGIYLVFLIYLKGVIPDAQTLLSVLKELYGTYGYVIVFVSAFLESMFVVSLYVPGSTAILLGAALSRTGVVQFPVVLFLAICGLLLGYIINYFLGKHGWYHVLSRMGLTKGLEVAKTKLEQHQIKTILLGYFHPTGASFLSTAAGVLKIPFRRFITLSVIAQVFWGLLWGGLSYLVGLSLVEFFLKYFTFFVIGVVAIWWIRKSLKK